MRLVWVAVAAMLALTGCGEDASSPHAGGPAATSSSTSSVSPSPPSVRDLPKDVCGLLPDDVLPGVARSSSRSAIGGAVCSINETGDTDQLGSATFMLALDEAHAAQGMKSFCKLQSGIGAEVPLPSGVQDGCGYAGDGWAAIIAIQGRALVMSSIRGHLSREGAVDQATRAVEALLPLAS